MSLILLAKKYQCYTFISETSLSENNKKELICTKINIISANVCSKLRKFLYITRQFIINFDT